MKGIRLFIPITIPVWLVCLAFLLMAGAGCALMYLATAILFESQDLLEIAKRIERFKVLP